jgi:uncharacterized protein
VCYTYVVLFEWDPQKAQANERKHDVSFEEAAECFADPLAMVLDDPKNPGRSILIGASRSCRLILTIYVEITERDVIRIVSARKATRPERRRYEEGEF